MSLLCYSMDEKEYTDIEETEVIKEIRLGLLMQEIDVKVGKEELIDWFARLQLQKRDYWCENITCMDLICIAEECGITVSI